MEDWALIRRLVADGVPKSRIATQLGISRATVFSAVESVEPPRYERSPIQTAFSPYELNVRSLLSEHPRMPAAVIAEQQPSVRTDNVHRSRNCSLAQRHFCSIFARR